MLQQKLYDALNGTITGSINALKAPQDTPKPYSIYRTIADTNALNADGMDLSYNEVRFQIDTYAKTLTEIYSILSEIETIIIASTKFNAIIYQKFDDIENEEFRGVLDFKLIKRTA